MKIWSFYLLIEWFQRILFIMVIVPQLNHLLEALVRNLTKKSHQSKTGKVRVKFTWWKTMKFIFRTIPTIRRTALRCNLLKVMEVKNSTNVRRLFGCFFLPLRFGLAYVSEAILIYNI